MEGLDAIVGAARNGEEWALRAVYEALAPQVRGYLQAQGEPEPDELLGDVFLQVVRDFASFRGDESALRAWILTIAHQELVDRRERHPGGPSEHVRDGEGGAGPIPEEAEEASLQASEQQRVNSMLNGLSFDQRSVVLLRAVGDLTIEQVAAVLGKRPISVRRLRRQGLTVLARHDEVSTNAEEHAHHQRGEREPDGGQLAEGSADELTRLLESAADRARELKRESESILHRVEEAIEGVRSAGAAQTSRRAPTRASARQGEASGPSAFAAVPEEALLRATQMAIRGDGRAEIEAMLGDEFGVASPADIVDQVLGLGPE